MIYAGNVNIDITKMTKRAYSIRMNQNFKTTLQTDCVVSGVLSFVLFLSRIAGIAPLRFERTQGGWCVRVSLLDCIYSYILLICFVIWSTIYYFGKGDEITDGRASWGAYTDVMRFLNGICIIDMIIVGSTIIYTNHSRMCCMIDCISQLTLINEKMNLYFTSLPTRNVTQWISVFTSLFMGYLIVFMDYGFYMYDMVLADKVGLLSCSLITVYLFSLNVHLYAIQFAMVVMLVVSTFQRVNNSLEIILYEIRNEVPISNLESRSEPASSLVRDVSTDNDNQMDTVNLITRYVTCVLDLVPPIQGRASSSPDKIRYLAIIYCSLCDLVRRLNISEGSALLATLLFSFMYMITTPYSMFNVLYTSGSEIPTTKCVLSFVFFLFAFMILATVVEPCHRTHTEVLSTRNLIDDLLRYTGSKAAAVRYELKLFKLHILLNPVSFSPCQLLTFNRTTLVVAVSTVIRNITVMMYL